MKKGKFVIPSYPMGDLSIEWDNKDQNSVEMAENLFEKFKEEGHMMVMVVDGKMKRVEEFIETASQILVLPKAKHGC